MFLAKQETKEMLVSIAPIELVGEICVRKRKKERIWFSLGDDIPIVNSLFIYF